jgi:hypothetical protein
LVPYHCALAGRPTSVAGPLQYLLKLGSTILCRNNDAFDFVANWLYGWQ